MEKVLQKSAKHYSKKLPSIFKKLQYKFKKALFGHNLLFKLAFSIMEIEVSF